MTDTTQSPTTAPTRLIYRSPSDRTEVAVREGDRLDIRVLRGRDDLSLAEGCRLAGAILAVIGEAEVTIPEATRAALTALGWTPPPTHVTTAHEVADALRDRARQLGWDSEFAHRHSEGGTDSYDVYLWPRAAAPTTTPTTTPPAT